MYVRQEVLYLSRSTSSGTALKYSAGLDQFHLHFERARHTLIDHTFYTIANTEPTNESYCTVNWGWSRLVSAG